MSALVALVVGCSGPPSSSVTFVDASFAPDELAAVRAGPERWTVADPPPEVVVSHDDALQLAESIRGAFGPHDTVVWVRTTGPEGPCQFNPVKDYGTASYFTNDWLHSEYDCFMFTGPPR